MCTVYRLQQPPKTSQSEARSAATDKLRRIMWATDSTAAGMEVMAGTETLDNAASRLASVLRTTATSALTLDSHVTAAHTGITCPRRSAAKVVPSSPAARYATTHAMLCYGVPLAINADATA